MIKQYMRVFREQLLSASLSAENFRVKRQFWSMFLGKNCFVKTPKNIRQLLGKKKVFLILQQNKRKLS